MPFYVALIHVVPQKKYAIDVCQALKNSVNDNGGLVRKINNAGRRPLPTAIKAKMGLGKQKFANIVTVEFMANPKCAITAFDTVRKMDYCMRMSLLRADELLLCRPPRPDTAQPKGCIQDWTPEDDQPPSHDLLELRAQFESELTLKMKEKVQQGQSLLAKDLRLPQERDLVLLRAARSSSEAGALEKDDDENDDEDEDDEEEDEDLAELLAKEEAGASAAAGVEDESDYSAFGLDADDAEDAPGSQQQQAAAAAKGKRNYREGKKQPK